MQINFLFKKPEPPKTKVHVLKSWPQFMDSFEDGSLTFDIRINDRSFQRGDFLVLREFDQHKKEYVPHGRTFKFTITYVLSGWGVAPGHVGLALQRH